MSEIKKIVELSDDSLDSISGGVILNDSCVVNRETGQRYAWLNHDLYGAFNLVNSLGDVPEGDKIAALQAAGYIVG